MIVGVNKFQLKQEDALDVRAIDNAQVRDSQIARLKQIKATRDPAKLKAALDALVAGAKGNGNLLELAVEAARARGHGGRNLRRDGERVRAASRRNPLHRGVYGAAYEGDNEFGAIRGEVEAFAKEEGRRPRMLVAKMGQDGTTAAPR